jgi:TRAP-type mannitol/chloroaromatic compound transport system permease small subunit
MRSMRILAAARNAERRREVAWDAVQNQETSFTEWTGQYWPVKLAIPIGAALIVLQDVCKLVKDIALVARRGA